MTPGIVPVVVAVAVVVVVDVAVITEFAVDGGDSVNVIVLRYCEDMTGTSVHMARTESICAETSCGVQ